MAIELKVISNTQQAHAEIDRLKAKLQSLSDRKQTAEVKVETRKAREELAALEKSLDKTNNSANQVAQTFKNFSIGLATIAGLGGTALALTRLADTVTNMDTRLRLVTSNIEGFNRAVLDTRNIALSSRQSLSTITTLYQRISQSSEQLRASQAQIGVVTQTVARAIAVSGSGIAEAQAAVMQLGQALSSGKLAGDELRSILENAPALAKTIADGLGTTIGQLRILGAEGKLTSKDIFDAILSQTKQVDAQFRKVGVTFGQAFTNIGNSLVLIWASIQRTRPAKGGLADQINNIAIGLADFADRIPFLMFKVSNEVTLLSIRIYQIFNEIPDKIVGIFNRVKDIFKNGFDIRQIKLKSIFDALGPIGEYVVNFVIKIDKAFAWLYDRVVGHSWVPDLVNEVIDWFQKLFRDGTWYVNKFTYKVGELFRSMYESSFVKGLRNAFSEMYDQSKPIIWKLQKSFEKIKVAFDDTSFAHFVKQALGIRDKVQYTFKSYDPNYPNGKVSDPNAYVGRGPDRDNKTRWPMHDFINALPEAWQVPALIGLTSIAAGMIVKVFAGGEFRSFLLAMLTTVAGIAASRTIDKGVISQFNADLTRTLFDAFSKLMEWIFGPKLLGMSDPLGLLTLIAKISLLWKSGREFMLKAVGNTLSAPTSFVNNQATKLEATYINRKVRESQSLVDKMNSTMKSFDTTIANAERNVEAQRKLFANTPRHLFTPPGPNNPILGQYAAQQFLNNAPGMNYNGLSNLQRMQLEQVRAAERNLRDQSIISERTSTIRREEQKRLEQSHKALENRAKEINGMVQSNSTAFRSGVMNAASGAGGIIGMVGGFQIGGEIAKGMVGYTEWAKIGVQMAMGLFGQATLAGAGAIIGRGLLLVLGNGLMLGVAALVAAFLTFKSLMEHPEVWAALKRILSEAWETMKSSLLSVWDKRPVWLNEMYKYLNNVPGLKGMFPVQGDDLATAEADTNIANREYDKTLTKVESYSKLVEASKKGPLSAEGEGLLKRLEAEIVMSTRYNTETNLKKNQLKFDDIQSTFNSAEDYRAYGDKVASIRNDLTAELKDKLKFANSNVLPKSAQEDLIKYLENLSKLLEGVTFYYEANENREPSAGRRLLNKITGNPINQTYMQHINSLPNPAINMSNPSAIVAAQGMINSIPNLFTPTQVPQGNVPFLPNSFKDTTAYEMVVSAGSMIEKVFSKSTIVSTLSSLVNRISDLITTMQSWKEDMHKRYSEPYKRARGGIISGPGSGTSDSIPTMLSNGEFVVNSKATSNNRRLLEAINGFQFGGIAADKDRDQFGGLKVLPGNMFYLESIVDASKKQAFKERMREQTLQLISGRGGFFNNWESIGKSYGGGIFYPSDGYSMMHGIDYGRPVRAGEINTPRLDMGLSDERFESAYYVTLHEIGHLYDAISRGWVAGKPFSWSPLNYGYGLRGPTEFYAADFLNRNSLIEDNLKAQSLSLQLSEPFDEMMQAGNLNRIPQDVLEGALSILEKAPKDWIPSYMDRANKYRTEYYSKMDRPYQPIPYIPEFDNKSYLEAVAKNDALMNSILEAQDVDKPYVASAGKFEELPMMDDANPYQSILFNKSSISPFDKYKDLTKAAVVPEYTANILEAGKKRKEEQAKQAEAVLNTKSWLESYDDYYNNRSSDIPLLSEIMSGIRSLPTKFMSNRYVRMLSDWLKEKLGFQGFATGGRVFGAGGDTTDSIPAMLSNGEFVVNAKATRKFRPLLESINSNINSSGIRYFQSGGIVTRDDVIRYANMAGVPPELALAIWQQESTSGENKKDSPSGAKGSFQIMPGTASMFPGRNVNDPVDNMVMGIEYLKKGMKASADSGVKDLNEQMKQAAQFYYGHILKPGEIGTAKDSRSIKRDAMGNIMYDLKGEPIPVEGSPRISEYSDQVMQKIALQKKSLEKGSPVETIKSEVKTDVDVVKDYVVSQITTLTDKMVDAFKPFLAFVENKLGLKVKDSGAADGPPVPTYKDKLDSSKDVDKYLGLLNSVLTPEADIKVTRSQYEGMSIEHQNMLEAYAIELDRMRSEVDAANKVNDNITSLRKSLLLTSKAYEAQKVFNAANSDTPIADQLRTMTKGGWENSVPALEMINKFVSDNKISSSKLSYDTLQTRSITSSQIKDIIYTIDTLESTRKHLTDRNADPKTIKWYTRQIEEQQDQLKRLVENAATKTEENKRPFGLMPRSMEGQQLGAQFATSMENTFQQGFVQVLKGKLSGKSFWDVLVDTWTSGMLDAFSKGITDVLFKNLNLTKLFSQAAGDQYDLGAFISSFATTGMKKSPDVGSVEKPVMSPYGLISASTNSIIGDTSIGDFKVGSPLGPSQFDKNTPFGSVSLEGQTGEPAKDQTISNGFTNLGADLNALGDKVGGVGGIILKVTGMITSILTSILSAVTAQSAAQAAGGGGTNWLGLITKGFGLLSGFGGYNTGGVSLPGSFNPENALGNVFDRAGLVPFARGGIVNKPTVFPFADGTGLMGEAGPEAIIPLARGADGKLGIKSRTGPEQQSQVFNINITGDVSRQTRNEIQKMIPQLAVGINQYNYESGYGR